MKSILEPQGWATVACETAEIFFQSLREREAGCVLLDVRLGGMSGLDVLREFRARGHRMPVVMLTGYGSVDLAVDSMKGGACDFLSKPFTAAQLVEKVGAALALDRKMAERDAKRREMTGRFACLTSRELGLLRHILDGKSSKVIANELGLSVRTVEHHRSAMLARTRAENFAHLVRLAVEAGIVSPSEESSMTV